MVKSITHVAINVKDMEKTLAFYRDALGFQKIFELSHPETGKPWIVYVQICAGQFLELFYDGTERTAKDSDIGFTHVCFQVDSVEEIAERITRNGYPLEIPPCEGCDHNLQTWTRDPNGVRIELMQVCPDSPHAAYM